jgi:hypothetical protein
MTAQLASALELLDFQPDLECGSPNCQHGRPPAEWRVIVSCGCRGLACDPCKQWGDATAHLHTVFCCRVCGAIRSGRLGDHRTFEPLPQAVR